MVRRMSGDLLNLGRVYIRRVCDETGLDYTNLARKAKMSSTTLTRPMNDKGWKRNFAPRTIAKIYKATGIEPPPDLLAGARISAGIASADVRAFEQDVREASAKALEAALAESRLTLTTVQRIDLVATFLARLGETLQEPRMPPVDDGSDLAPAGKSRP